MSAVVFEKRASSSRVLLLQGHPAMKPMEMCTCLPRASGRWGLSLAHSVWPDLSQALRYIGYIGSGVVHKGRNLKHIFFDSIFYLLDTHPFIVGPIILTAFFSSWYSFIRGPYSQKTRLSIPGIADKATEGNESLPTRHHENCIYGLEHLLF